MVQKNTDVPSGAATAEQIGLGIAAGAGQHGGEQRLRPPGRRRSASAVSMPSAATEAPARPAAGFTSTRESPCCHSWTGFVRCWPVRAKPSAPRALLDLPGRAAVHRQLDEGVAVQLLRRRQFEQAGPPPDLGRQPGGRLLLEGQQRAQRVDGRPAPGRTAGRRR